MHVSKETFQELTKAAFNKLPVKFKEKLDNIDIIVLDNPNEKSFKNKRKDLRGLLGLYKGVPLRKRGVFYSNVLSDRIILYKENIESRCNSKEQLENKIEDVLFHEIGHYFGLTEKDLYRIQKGKD